MIIKTIIQVTVLHDENAVPPTRMCLGDIAQEMDEGCFVGNYEVVSSDPLENDQVVLDELLAVGNDGTFFEEYVAPDAKIAERVTKVIKEQLGISLYRITPELSLVEDLAMDSLDLVEMAMAMEDEFTLELADDQCVACETVQDVIDMIAREVKEQS